MHITQIDFVFFPEFDKFVLSPVAFAVWVSGNIRFSLFTHDRQKLSLLIFIQWKYISMTKSMPNVSNTRCAALFRSQIFRSQISNSYEKSSSALTAVFEL